MRQNAKARGTPQVAALGRSLALLEAIVTDREGRSLATIAAQLGLPRATAHRQVATFLREGYLARLANGALIPGAALRALTQAVDPTRVLVAAARPVLTRLAAKLACVAQLGTLDEDMVTYRLKVGDQAGQFFTRLDQQLEAYCTGLGKVFLAHLPEREREAYLATGPFPALTANTITDPAALRAALDRVRDGGYAVDEQEIAEGLTCFAAPIMVGGHVRAAISVSIGGAAPEAPRRTRIIAAVLAAAHEIGAVMAGQPRADRAPADPASR